MMRRMTMLRTAAITTVLALTAVASFAASIDDEKLDQITLKDGRQFTGHVIEEDDASLTMKIIFSGITSTRTFRKSQLIEILHDTITVEGSGDGTATSETPDRDLSVRERAKGRRIVQVIPFRGLIGWQMYGPNLERLWDRAVASDVDTVVLEFDCFEGMYDLEEYRDVLQDIKVEAAQNEIQVVVWMKKAEGAAVAYALLFPEIYFHPTGFMGKGKDLNTNLEEMFPDEDVRAKMISAWVGICRGMAEEGGYDALLCDAMIRPELTLGVRFEGERSIFGVETGGEFTAVDTSKEEAVELTAQVASRFNISKGEASSVEDLMRNLNHREYYIHEGDATDFVEKWIDGYDRAWDEYFEIRADIAQINGWDLDPKRKLGMQLNKLKEIQRMLRRYPPLGKPPYGQREDGVKYGVIDPLQLEFEIDELRRQIQSMDEQNRQNSPGGGGGRPGG